MPPDKGKQPAAPPSPHTFLAPAPLFSPRSRRSLPHLVDTSVDEPPVPEYQHDDVFWNSALEEGDGEDVPEHDELGRVKGTGRTYWVRDSGLQEHKGSARDIEVDESKKGGPATLDFGFDDERERSPSPSSSTFSNWDLYKPPTPPWPKRSSSLRGTHFQPRSTEGGTAGSATRHQRDEREYDAREMRGGGQVQLLEVQSPYALSEVNIRPHVQPSAFEFSLSPTVLGNMKAFAEVDPLVDGGRRRAYRALLTAASEEDDMYLREMERPDVHLGETRRKMPQYEGPGWEGDTPRSKMADVVNLDSGPESEAGEPKPESLISPPEPLLLSLEEAIRRAGTGRAPDIADHPAFRDEKRTMDIALTDGIEEEELADMQEQVSTNSRSARSAPPPSNGIPATIEEEWPVTDYHPPSPKRNGTIHSPRPIRPTSSPLTPTHDAQPPALPTDDEAQAFILRTHSRTPSPTTTLPYYATLLSTQASSIRYLNALIADLTDRSDYYEHNLLPRTLSHWATTNTENHSLSAELRRVEEENALLWDMLDFSRKMLNLCWEREEAVLETARTMRVRKINRANCGLLERLVGRFGAGNGGGNVKERERRKNRGRVESPFREDVEQLVSVCEQNLRVLDEDLEDWSMGVQRVEEVMEARTEEAKAQRVDEDGNEGRGRMRGEMRSLV